MFLLHQRKNSPKSRKVAQSRDGRRSGPCQLPSPAAQRPDQSLECWTIRRELIIYFAQLIISIILIHDSIKKKVSHVARPPLMAYMFP